MLQFLRKNASPPAPDRVGSGLSSFLSQIIVYLTFSESFKTIEPIVQKILTDPKIIFSKIGNFPIKGELFIFARLLYCHLSIAAKHFANINSIAIHLCRPFFTILGHFWTPGFWHIIDHNSRTVNNWGTGVWRRKLNGRHWG